MNVDTMLFSTSNLKYNNISYKDMAIEEGKLTFICGASGTGKTTLFKLLNKTLSADSGDIFYKNEDINSLDTIMHRQQVLLLSQNTFLSDSSVKENFEEFYSYRKMACPSELEMKKILELCLVPFGLDASCTNMSGGEKKRVYLAICLSFMPKVLLLDELTSPLDDANSYALFRNLKEFSTEHGMTLLAISHNSNLVKDFADVCVNLSA